MAEPRGGAGKWIGIGVLIAAVLGVLCCGGVFLGLKLTLESSANVIGSGTPASETRDVAAFERLSIRTDGNLRVEVRVGGERSLTVEADDNVLPILTTEVVDGSLVIGSRDSFRSELARVVVEVPELDAVSIDGAAKLSVTGVAATAFEVAVAGAADVRVEGSTGDLTVRLAGAGEVDLAPLVARDVAVRMDGAWDVLVHAEESLEVDINGAGSLEYEGDPERLVERINGVGSVSQVKDR